MIWQNLIEAIANIIGTTPDVAGALFSLLLMLSAFITTLMFTRDMMAIVVIGFIMTVFCGVAGWLSVAYTVGFLVVFSIVGALAARQMGGGRGE
jgi:hypothetical protein